MDTCYLSYQGIGCQIEMIKYRRIGGILGERFNQQFCISQTIKWGNHMITDNHPNVSKPIDET